MTATIETLVDELYAALARGDADALDDLLAEDFVGRFADGMPAGAGVHEGPVRAREDGWWAIGRAYAVLARPEETVRCDDGRLLVRGRYRGTERSSGREVDAAFMHLWRAQDGRLAELDQVTDTARWTAAS